MNLTSLRERLSAALGQPVINFRSARRGDAAHTFTGSLQDGRRFFAKTARIGAPFEIEALGLQRLKMTGSIQVPDVWHVEPGLLVLEQIDFGSPAPDHAQALGRGLAQMHLCLHDAYGFDADHAIGLTPQKNQPWVPQEPGAWAAFWWTHRLEPMIRRLPPEAIPAFAALETRIAGVVEDTDAAPSLLHGDLWAGNVAADSRGTPVIFDPAPYYGHREADLAMTRMFGGFGEDFYQAYHEANPLATGWQDRLGFYMLYHVLNHWILFGSSYSAQAYSLLHAYR
jgi:fructosamine-3-kinase